MNDFKKIRNNLIDMLEDLDESLGGIANQSEQVDELAHKSIEPVAKQISSTEKESSKNEIEKIKQAISGIDNGTYGICLICGLAIKNSTLKKIKSEY